jgi:Fe2+ or Zn2+ uptake regulation protein
MSESLSPLQADILAVLAAADGPVSTTDVPNELNAHVRRRVVAEQVYTALRGLHGRGLVRRAQATGTRNAHWHRANEEHEAG